MYDIGFPSPDTVYISTLAIILGTVNGGANWSQQVISGPSQLNLLIC